MTMPRPAVPAALALLAALAACSKSAPTPTPQVPVSVAVARRGAAPHILTANGQMYPLETAKVVAQVTGLVTEVTFREGESVRQGQVLFRIDPRPYQDALAEAQAQLARDASTTQNAVRSADRLGALAHDDYATRSSVDSAASIAAASRATVAYDQAAVRRAQFDLGNTTIRAPIAGRTGSLLVRRGNYVQADPNLPLVVINQIDPILVQFSVPASTFSELQLAGRPKPLPVRVSPTDPATASGSTAPGSTATDSAVGITPSASMVAGAGDVRGTLSFVDNMVDTATGMVRLKAQLANPDGRLWPGQFAFISLQLSVQQDALLIPGQAVELGQQPAVYVVQPDGQAVRRLVGLGATVGNLVVVTRGLSTGERVITDGMSRLRPGARVRVVGVDSSARMAVSAP
jgi:multidrug efflux system membrane fusion protein